MAEKGFLIGPGFAHEIKQTIATVKGRPLGSGGYMLPRDFSGDEPSGSAKAFRVCTFTGAWAINAQKTVTFRGVTSTPNTASATNLFANITAATGTRNCAIAKDGTSWYLIAAECG